MLNYTPIVILFYYAQKTYIRINNNSPCNESYLKYAINLIKTLPETNTRTHTHTWTNFMHKWLINCLMFTVYCLLFGISGVLSWMAMYLWSNLCQSLSLKNNCPVIKKTIFMETPSKWALLVEFFFQLNSDNPVNHVVFPCSDIPFFFPPHINTNAISFIVKYSPSLNDFKLRSSFPFRIM